MTPLPLASAPFSYAGELAALVSALLWASAGIVFARLRPPIGAASINLAKNVVATLCFAVLLMATTGAPWPFGLSGRSVFWFALSGLAGLTVCDTFLIRSLLTIGPQRMSLVMTIHPVIVAIAAMAPPFREYPPALAWVGMAVCLAGVGLAILERPPTPVGGRGFAAGLRDAALAAVFQAAGILLARYGLSLAEGSAADGATVRLAFGALGSILIGLPALRIIGWTRELRRGRVAMWIVGASFIGTFLGIWLNQLGLEWTTHTGVATTLNAMGPIYLIPLSAVFLHERHTRRGWIATLVAVAGVALIAFAR